MHDKIEALSRRFTCQNEAIDEEMREDIVHCFNAAMMEATEKLIRQTISREQRNRYIHNLHNILADLRECYEIRQEHFEQQIYVKHLEKHLAMARRHELEKTHKVTSEQLSEVLHLVSIAQNHHDDLSAKLKECRDTIIEGQRVLESSEKLYETQKTQIEEARGRVKDMQISNSAKRKTNKATIIHINAMEAECKRLELAICECRDEERKERTKAEALEKLYKQITCDVESAEQDADHARGLHKSQAGNQGPEPDGQ